MLDDKLLRHYSHLVELGVQQDIVISLKDISEKLFTSLRHARTLLKSMQELEWLAWTPKVGRNQRSLLRLHYDLKQLKADIAASFIALGKYEKALMIVDGDHSVFGHLLQKTSGAMRREGQLHIQLTYHRLFSSLLPHKPQRSGERFFMRQIYCSLVRCDKSGTLTPELAHHWKHNEERTRWKFYLRPQLFFHNGREINADEVVKLFKQLKALPEYEKELNHLQHISVIHPLCLEFHLTQADYGFAGLLADLRYSIQPSEQVTHPLSAIIGSGAFQLQEHSKERIQLQAFDKFYACRALTDTVTIWQLPQKIANSFANTLLNSNSFANTLLKIGVLEQSQTSRSHSLQLKETPNTASREQEHTRIEDGYLLLLFNQKSSETGLSAMQRRYLSNLLTANRLLNQLEKDEKQFGASIAHHLLPRWHKVYKQDVEKQRLPESLNIAVFDHLALLDCANAISAVLDKIGIHCQINIYSYAELQHKALNKQLNETLILTSFNLDDNRPTSIFRWLLSDPVLHQALSGDGSDWLTQALSNVRASQPLSAYFSELESIVTSMLYANWVSPLFHHRQTLKFEGILKGVSITDWGWPAIKDVWSED